MLSSFKLSHFFQQFLYDKNAPLLFNNGFFVCLFVFFIVGYFLCKKNIAVRTNWFCFVSLYFFYKASGLFVILVIIAAVADFFLSNLIYQQQNKSRKKALLFFSIAINLGLLIYFKYTNFFIAIINSSIQVSLNPLNILLPIGISFYTFENISYTVDVYKGEFTPVKKFNEYLLFLSFFPKLVMGPIVRAKDFIPQMSLPYQLSKRDFAMGFMLIITGLFKKLIISDYISLNFVNYIFDAPGKYTGLECLFALYGYAMVIYCDFSGYSSIAIGLAKWLGYSIPANFLSPYQSKNITEFWRRWHISLSTWLRDYLYIPLGGSRKGKLRTYLNLFITMVLGGFWHGANLNFIIWGGLHGVALGTHKFANEKFKDHNHSFFNSSFFKALAVIITFHFVCFCWIFFKVNNFATALEFINQIRFHFVFSAWEGFVSNYKYVLLFILLAMLLHVIPDKYVNIMPTKLETVHWSCFVLILLIFIIIYGFFKTSTPILPIYLQF